MKKIVSLFLALVFAMGLITSAYAVEGGSDTHTIRIQADANSGLTTGHEYSVYQIFVGDLGTNEKGETVLTDVKYGTAGVGTLGQEVSQEVLQAIQTDGARDYAQQILSDTDITLTKYATLNATNSWTITEVPSGYYLIVDDTTKEIEKGDSYSEFIVKVVEDVRIAPKSENVTGDKSVYNDAVQKVDLNEAGVGSKVSYELNAKIADNADKYDFYYFVLADTLSNGLTFNGDVKVKIGAANAVVNEDYKLYVGEDGYTFEIALLNAKAHKGEEVTVNYTATVNSSAVAMIPEKNTFEVIYSNNPEYKYYPGETPNKPGKPDIFREDIFGSTPEQETETYTTKLVLTKKNEKQEALAGATFRLTSANANQTILNTYEYYKLDNVNGTYYLLKDGTYTETAPTDATYEKVGTGDSKTTVGYIKQGNNYIVPQNTKDYAGEDLYVYRVGTNSLYTSTNKYVKETATSDASELSPVDILLTTGADGVLTFDGLGTGDYVLTEVDAPDGYNYVKPISFTITFDAANKTFNIVNVQNAQIATTAGTFSTTVIDQSGAVLPSTGGSGTTMLYAIGTILVVGAGVLFVTKRRMASK